MKLTLSCPHAVYRDGTQIWCTKLGARCVHVYFKQCKGWWALTPQADSCPLREEEGGENYGDRTLG